jgi:hypothetical protein
MDYASTADLSNLLRELERIRARELTKQFSPWLCFRGLIVISSAYT